MLILHFIVYGLVLFAGLGVWAGLVHLLTNWKKPWHRILSVTLLCGCVAVLASLITSSIIETRDARKDDHTYQKEPNKAAEPTAINPPPSATPPAPLAHL